MCVREEVLQTGGEGKAVLNLICFQPLALDLAQKKTKQASAAPDALVLHPNTDGDFEISAVPPFR